MAWTTDAVRVRVPATSANLGPGFDALGLALTLYDEVEARFCGPGWRSRSPATARTWPTGEAHLVVRAMRAAFAVTGGHPPGLGLRCANRIPHGRGLGSSAAAIVAGVLAARALAGAGAAALPDSALLAAGHRDGGASRQRGGLPARRADHRLDRGRRATDGPARAGRPIRPVVCVGPAPVRTQVARRLLPDVVPHPDAAANAGRSALLVAALTQLPRSRARCSPRPRTGCIRTTGPGRCRKPRRSSPGSGRLASRPSCPGPGRRCWPCWVDRRSLIIVTTWTAWVQS